MLSISYPSPVEGFWTPVTSTINWCEEDYYATIYVAEIVNSFTMLIFIYFAYVGISSCVRNRHPQIFLIAYISYLVIGIGSFLFHASLKYWMQLLDELSMVYTTCVLFYAVFSYGQSSSRKYLLLALITSVATFITTYYHYIKDPLFHQNMFALLTTIVVLRSIYIMEHLLRPAQKSTNVDATNARVAEIRKRMHVMIACGITSVALGFLIWNLDNIFCASLRRWRRAIGLPWGILLEGHGWWHIFTGIAAYLNITYSLWLQYCRDGKQNDIDLVWPSIFGSVPYVERRSEAVKKEVKRF